MPLAGSAFAQLHQYLHHTRLLGSISSALYYDQNTVMPAAKVRSGKGFSAGGADDTGAVKPQGPVWIGKDFRLDRAGPTGDEATGTSCCMARSVRAGGCSGFSRCTWGSAERRRQMRGSPCAGENPAGIPPGQWLKAPAPVPESRAPAAD